VPGEPTRTFSGRTDTGAGSPSSAAAGSPCNRLDEPTKPATNADAGRSYTSAAVPTCSIRPPVEDGDPVAHGQSLVLVVGHEQEGDADVTLDALELDLHLLAQLEVEGAQGLVEQQHPGAVDEGAGQRHPLPLAAGQLPRPPAAEAAEPDRVQRLLGPGLALGLAHALHHQAVGDVLRHRHVREERVVLEDRVHVAVERGVPGDVAAAEVHRAGRGLLESRRSCAAPWSCRSRTGRAWRRTRRQRPRGRPSPPRRRPPSSRRGRRTPCAARRDAPRPRSTATSTGWTTWGDTLALRTALGNGFRRENTPRRLKSWPERD
jgi:hypothetical protein